MKKSLIGFAIIAATVFSQFDAAAQFRNGKVPQEKTEAQQLMEEAEAAEAPLAITLEQALKIALSENVAVKIADKEIQRSEYAKKGTYSSLYPQLSGTGSYQRTLIKNDIRAMMGDGGFSDMMKDTKIGNSNTFNVGAALSMPVINPQLWKSLKISDISVETAVEKARSSKLDMVNQVKQAYYSSLLAKEALDVYQTVYDNAVANYEKIELKYKAQKASELEYLRAKTNVSNAIPNLYDAENSVFLALWQLKAVMGVDLDMNIDTVGELNDYAETLFYDLTQTDSLDLSGNSSLRQLDLQANVLEQTWKLQKLAYAPTVSLMANITYSSVANDPIKKLSWFPYSYAGLTLQIPIFSGFKRMNDVRQAKNQYEQVQLTRQDTERQLRIAAQNYVNTMASCMKSYYSSLDAVQSAEKSFEIMNRSYELGRATLTDLNDATVVLVQSRLVQSQVVYNFIVAKANLEKMISNDFLYEE
ncbi:MAG: TolC family protein [Bacteroidales bacterium]|nr:TolC family protein [Candidatus Cryptobacteroides caccocaballi]